LNYKSKFNGARGAIHLYNEICDQYIDKEKGGIFWNKKRTYKASISNQLFITVAAQLYLCTFDKKYLDDALKVY
jgi:predicted alpha-1,6-mannanase (GH76 family)